MSNCTAVAGWIGKEGVDVKVNRSGGPGRRDCSLFPLPCPGLLSCLYFGTYCHSIHFASSSLALERGVGPTGPWTTGRSQDAVNETNWFNTVPSTLGAPCPLNCVAGYSTGTRNTY